MPSSQLQRLLDRALRERRPGEPTAAPIEQGDGVGRRVAEHRHRRLDLAEAERGGGGRVGGEQQRVVERLVTCAWLLGVRRARILVIAICSSTGRSSASDAGQLGRASCPPTSRTSSARGTVGSTGMRAQRDVVERHRLRRDAEVEPVPRDELVDDVEVGLGAARRARPPGRRSTTSDGSGSSGASKAIRPSAGSSTAKPSRLTALRVHEAEAADALAHASALEHGRAAPRGDATVLSRARRR